MNENTSITFLRLMALAESSRLLCRICLVELQALVRAVFVGEYTAGLAKTRYELLQLPIAYRRRTSSEAFVLELQSKGTVGGGEATDLARTSSADLETFGGETKR